MRILFISDSTKNASAPTAMLNLVSGLKARGNEIAAIFPDAKGPVVKKFQDLGITTFCNEKYTLSIKKYKKKVLKNKQLLSSYVRYVIEEFHPDIVHTNVGTVDIAVEPCLSLGIPHVWHMREYQDLDFGVEYYDSKKKYEELLSKNGNYNIAISQGIFEHWNLRISDRVIYNGIYSQSNVPSANEEERESQFLYVGRLQKAKSFGFLVTTFKKFIKTHPGYQLNVLGKPADLYGCFWKIWCHLNFPKGSIKFTRKFHRTDIYAAMGKAKALILPGRFEAFGFIGSNAMLCECTVIGRNTSGTKELLDNGLRQSGKEVGLRFSTKNELFETMEFVATGDPSLYPMKEAARKFVIDNYSIERSAELVENYYNDILTTRKSLVKTSAPDTAEA